MYTGGEIMSRQLKDNFFNLIKDYFTFYLPNQKKFSAYTINSYRDTMNSLLDFIVDYLDIDIMDVEFKIITVDVMNAFIKKIESNGNSDSTINQRISAIRSFYKYASIMDITKVIYRNEICKIPLRKVNITRKKLDYLKVEHIQLLMEMPNTNVKIGVRDLCIIAILYDGGLRISELKEAKVNDVHVDSGKSYITVKGKGKKYRNVPLSDKTINIFKKYFDIYYEQKADNEDYLFYTIIHENKNKMSDDNINAILKKYAKKAHMIDSSFPLNIHAHIIRHSRAMHLYQGGVELPLVSQWLGHEQIQTTLIYAYADTEMKRKAIEKAEIINKNNNQEDYEVFKGSDKEEVLKRLYGLK